MQRIIPRLRSEVFEGVHILFSSVIPLDTQPETTEIWRMAHMFGARVSTELKNDITHVVAAKVCPNPHVSTSLEADHFVLVSKHSILVVVPLFIVLFSGFGRTATN